MVDLLLEQGADVNAADDRGHTALIWSAIRGCDETVELCLDYGALPEWRGHDGFKAVDWARKNQRSGCVITLWTPEDTEEGDKEGKGTGEGGEEGEAGDEGEWEQKGAGIAVHKRTALTPPV